MNILCDIIDGSNFFQLQSKGSVNSSNNLQLKDVLFPVCPVQETEHLHHILVVHCICTFQVCQQETLLKQCFVFARSKETTLQSGSGFKSIIQERYYRREKGFQNLSSTRYCLKLDLNSSGYGQQQQQQQSPKIGKFSHLFS